MSICYESLSRELFESNVECIEEIESLKVMIRQLVSIIESEYPESDERYQFAMNCLTDVGDEK